MVEMVKIWLKFPLILNQLLKKIRKIIREALSDVPLRAVEKDLDKIPVKEDDQSTKVVPSKKKLRRKKRQ